RALILDAARTLFERNPDGFTVASVCRKTGLSRAKLRKHFSNKSALIACLKDTREQQQAPVEPCDQISIVHKVEGEAVIEAPSIPPTVLELPPIVAEPITTVPKKKRTSPAKFRARETAQQILAQAEQDAR